MPLLIFLSACVTPEKLTTRFFSSMEEMISVIKKDFKESLADLKDTIYYFPPITSEIPGDTTIIMFGSRKPLMCIKAIDYSINRKNRVLGDTTIVLFPEKNPAIYLTNHSEYYVDKKKLKILWIEHHKW